MWRENQRAAAEVMASVLTYKGLSTSSTDESGALKDIEVEEGDVEAVLVAFSRYMRKEPEPGDEVEVRNGGI
jgi:hypothetical protein